MDKEKHFFAVDLGATSGRTIVGTLKGGRVTLEEQTRFANPLTEIGGHFYWNILSLYNEILRGLSHVCRSGIKISSIGIDTWGVDFVCIGRDGALLGNPMAYRDPCTFDAMESYLSSVSTRQDVYDTTGIQFMNFNSLFQLYAMRREDNQALRHAEKILFIPDALSYMLTGNAVCERTIASTSQLLNPRTGQLDDRLLNSLALSRHHFGRMVNPGELVGTLTEEVQRQTGLGPIPVIAVAGHDTASAVAAVPASDEMFAYLSSGTWSLMGIETPTPIINKVSFDRNFTNEGGIDHTTRFLKNICGMWLLERCRKEWGNKAPEDYSQIIAEAQKQTPFESLINPDDPSFANPQNMERAIRDYCARTGQKVPEGYAAVARCIFDSLALRYRQVFGYLKEMAPFAIDRLHVIGGGSRNALLNQFTANATGAEVLAGPQECTALGNVMVQARAAGVCGSIWDMRQIIRESVEMTSYQPADADQWNAAYEKWLKICGE